MHQRGFSLLEILVAFSIMALSLGVLMEIFADAARNADLARNQMRATALARSLLARTALDATLTGGEHEGTDGPLRWRLRVAPYEGSTADDGTVTAGSSPLLDAWLISVSVGWGEPADAAARSVALDTLRVRPKTPP
jgi:general secretion pathway protein I